MADKYCATSGSDTTGTGTLANPWATPQKLIDNLAAGDIGWIRAGTYTPTGQYVLDFSAGGTSTSPVTVKPYPGEVVTLNRTIQVRDGANYVTISGSNRNLRWDGTGGQASGIQVMGDNFILEECDLTYSAGIGVEVGIDGFGQAVNCTIRRNFFHDIGLTAGTPSQAHSIYINDASGGEITDNVFSRVGGFHVHFYGRSDGMHVHHNVMDAASQSAVMVAGYGGTTAPRVPINSLIERNLLTNSTRYGVESYWDNAGTPTSPGTGNQVSTNVIFGNAFGTTTGTGFTVTGSSTTDPQYVNESAHTLSGLQISTTSPALTQVTYDTARLLLGAGTQTQVARISLAPAASPGTRTNHQVQVRCRVQTAAAATLRAQLYEGSTPRSGVLETSALTTSLATYSLPVADSNAAAITDYSNLELRFWGYSASGATPVVEVAEAALQIPQHVGGSQALAGSTAGSSSLSGALSTAITVTPTARVSLASATTPGARTLHQVTVRCRVTGSGTVTLRARLYEGATARTPELETPTLTTSLATYVLPIADSDAASITDYSNLELRFYGRSASGASTQVEVAEIALQAPTGSAVSLAGSTAGTSGLSGGLTSSGTVALAGLTMGLLFRVQTVLPPTRSGFYPRLTGALSVSPGGVTHALTGATSGTSGLSGSVRLSLPLRGFLSGSSGLVGGFAQPRTGIPFVTAGRQVRTSLVAGVQVRVSLVPARSTRVGTVTSGRQVRSTFVTQR